MGGPPLRLGNDALLAEFREQEHVREAAIDESCGRDPERQQPLRSAEDRDGRGAHGSDDLGKARVTGSGFDRRGAVQRDARTRGVATLEEPTGFPRQPLPHRCVIVLGQRAEERRCQQLRRVLVGNAIRAHHSSVIRSTARNASCGISTAPTIFIRFLPFFCFSRSFFLRVMSPP